jgi:hypothetical protein
MRFFPAVRMTECFNARFSAVARLKAALPPAGMYCSFQLLFVFSLYEGKNEQQYKDKAPLCRRQKPTFV